MTVPAAPPPAAPLAAGPLLERLQLFVDELRHRGLPVSLGERIDAMRAVDGLALDTTAGLHTALSATLVKSADHLAVFDETFRLYFQLAQQPRTAAPDAAVPLDLEHALRTVLREGSETLARMVAEQAVAQFVDFEPGRPVAGVLYEQRTVRGLQLAEISAQVAGEGGDTAGANGAAGPAGARSAGRQLGQVLHRDEVAARTELLRRQVREVIRELLVADRGVEAVARTLRTPLPEDVVIANASATQLAELNRIMQSLQRKLATMMMRKRRSRRGALDVRATLRASMATGGVPVRLVPRRPAPTKTQLYVLADVSGSVATFAAFTITLVSGMSQVFARLRTFAFVANALEVTDLFRDRAADPVAAVNRLNNVSGLNFLDASTDYGRSLRQFWQQVGSQLGRRSTVLIFGDARGNYRPAEEATLAHIAKTAGAVYWLNPEREAYWGTGDSLMKVYAPHCTAAISCRTLADLRRFVENLD